MLEHRFGETRLPSVGVELELQLVDVSTLALRPGIDAIFAELPVELSGSVRREFHACCAELATEICASVDEIRRDLKAKLSGSQALLHSEVCYLRGEERILSRTGTIRKSAAIRGIAAWPTPSRRSLRRQLTFGLHVHVGVDCADVAIKTCDQLRYHLPVLLRSRPTVPSGAVERPGSRPIESRSWAVYLSEEFLLPSVIGTPTRSL